MSLIEPPRTTPGAEASSTSTGGSLRLLAARGNPLNPSIFSGIPYYFLKAAVKGQILDGPVPLPKDGADFHIRRIAWNLVRPLTGDRPGGYQYTPGRRNRQWEVVRPTIRGGTCILSAWQLLPRWVVRDESIEKWFFIDQTLSQLYEDYGEHKVIGQRIARNALVEEREGYEAATGIITHSRWAARSVIERYGIPPSKVYVVRQAANIDELAYAEWEEGEQSRREARAASGPAPLRLVFVGLDGRRKGLDRLLRGLAIARRDGCQATLRVIGCPPNKMPRDLRALPGVEWCGRVNKGANAARFLRLVGDCQVGCLLSRVEAGGCGLSEYQILGLAVLGTNAGGAAEQVLPGNGSIIDVKASDEEIAHTLVQLEKQPELVESMRQLAWRQRRSATWGARVDEMRSFWPHVTRAC